MSNMVYTRSVNETSATLSDISSGYDSSHVREDAAGKRYRLFKNGGSTIAYSRGLEATGLGTDNVVTVQVYTTTTFQGVGATQSSSAVNGTAGTNIPASHYFWGQIGGLATVNGTVIVGSAVKFAATGTVAAYAGSEIHQPIGHAAAAITAADGVIVLNLG